MQVTKTTTDTIDLRWLAGYNGGYDQTFVFDYRIEKTSSWNTQEYNPDVSDKSVQTYQITGLANGKLYEVKMCAKNNLGSSGYTSTISVSTASTGIHFILIIKNQDLLPLSLIEFQNVIMRLQQLISTITFKIQKKNF